MLLKNLNNWNTVVLTTSCLEYCDLDYKMSGLLLSVYCHLVYCHLEYYCLDYSYLDYCQLKFDLLMFRILIDLTTMTY